MRIVTDVDALAPYTPPGVTVRTFSRATIPGRLRRWLLLARAARSADIVLLHFFIADIAFFTALFTLVPFPCRLMTLDLFLGPQPHAWKLWIWRVLLRQVSRFLVYIRDTGPHERLYRIPRSGFCYVPFRVLGLDHIRSLDPREEDYLFSGGRSRRDFRLLLEVVEELGLPLQLVASAEPLLRANGSSLSGLRVPPNVRLHQPDVPLDELLRRIAGARLVVLPILPGTLMQAGISVALMAMALGKCVILSAGPGVSDVFQSGEAMVVEAGSRTALRDAIHRAWNDPRLRQSYARSGYRYAQMLGEDGDFRKRILEAILAPHVPDGLQ